MGSICTICKTSVENLGIDSVSISSVCNIYVYIYQSIFLPISMLKSPYL